jgi:penicillin-binding protein 1A
MARANPRKKRSKLRAVLKWTLILGILAGLAGVGALAGLVWLYSQDLPSIETAQDYRPKEVTRIYAADGEVLATLTDAEAIQRTVLSYDEMPQVMRDAIIAAEDSGFYTHPGLDFVGLLRAIKTNIMRGSLSQGASTITQQVVKNLVLSPERTIRRKIQEAVLAFRLEDRLTKDEILTIYLNEVFFGSRYYGVEEASRYYFGHGAAELTLAEAALLAGLVQSPNRYNPHFHLDRALQRRTYVLRQMWEKGFIDESVYREADASEVTLDPRMGVGSYDGEFAWYTDAVRRELLTVFGPEFIFSSGLRVDTAMDVQMQSLAEDALASGLRDYDGRHGYHTPYTTLDGAEAVSTWRREHHGDVATLGFVPERVYRAVVLSHSEEQTVVGVGGVVAELSRQPLSRVRPDERPWEELFPIFSVFSVRTVAAVPADQLSAADPTDVAVELLPSAQAALVAVDPTTRHVIALVGGYDFDESPFNRAVQATRQVGSAFKPVVYGAALQRRAVTPATVLLDQPVTFPMHGGETWQPRNYDGRYLGPLTMRTALARSRNVVAVRVLDLIGIDAAQGFARQLGVTSDLTDNLTLALGSAELSPLEITNAFSTIAADGLSADPIFIVRVTDSRGNVLYEPGSEPVQTVDPDLNWLLTSMMRSVVERGTATRAQAVGHPVAGKTGTTNGARDAWFLGFSRHIVAGVWVGRDDNVELGRGETGGGTALPIWVDFMTRAHEGREVRDFPSPPPGIERVAIDPSTGLRARDGQESYMEYFLTGTVPAEYAPTQTDQSVQEILLGGGGGAGSQDDDGF